jgi:hypothetical protein
MVFGIRGLLEVEYELICLTSTVNTGSGRRPVHLLIQRYPFLSLVHRQILIDFFHTICYSETVTKSTMSKSWLVVLQDYTD